MYVLPIVTLFIHFLCFCLLSRRARQEYPSTDEDPRQPHPHSRPLHDSPPHHQQQYTPLAVSSPAHRQHRPRDGDSVDMPANQRPARRGREPEYEKRRGKVGQVTLFI